jgi:hypothetical protein
MSFSNVVPQARHLYSKIGIPGLPGLNIAEPGELFNRPATSGAAISGVDCSRIISGFAGDDPPKMA